MHFSALNTFTVNVRGLPSNVAWTLIISNSTYADASSTTANDQLVFGPAAVGSFTWAVYATGYVATPSGGQFSLATNSTTNVTFAAAATLTFSETGLASGAAWTVWLTQNGVTTSETGAGSSVVFAAEAGAYNYTLSAPGYTASGATGSGTLPANGAVSVAFTPTAGSLSLTVTTGGATATVNGQAVTLPFSQSEAPGVYAIVVSESGYVTYYNNVSVASGKPSTLSVTLTPTSSSSSSSSNGISTMAWLLIAVLAALAVIFLITTLLFMRRGRTPPKMTAYTPPPATAATTAPPPAGAPPIWSEGGNPPPRPPPGAS